MSYLPHIICLRSETWLVVLSAAADFLTGLAYFAIPAIILWQDHHDKLTIDRYLKPIWMILAVFIFSCGIGHWIDLANLWLARYELKAFIGWCTTCASFAAVWEFLKRGPRYHRNLRIGQSVMEMCDRIEAKWPTVEGHSSSSTSSNRSPRFSCLTLRITYARTATSSFVAAISSTNRSRTPAIIRATSASSTAGTVMKPTIL